MIRAIRIPFAAIVMMTAIAAVLVGAGYKGRIAQDLAKRAGPIRGKIVLPDGKPAERVRLSLVKTLALDSAVVAEATTDASGAFLFADLPWPEIGEPELKLVAEKEGYGLSFRGLADWKNGDILKMAGASELRLSLHEPDGRPATGTKVWPELLVFQTPDHRTQFLTLPDEIRPRYTATCRAGAISIPGLPRGVQLRLAHDSPSFARFTFEQPVALAFTAVTDAGEMHFAIGSSLSGRVTRTDTSEPVTGTLVHAQEAFDPDGGGGGRGYGIAKTDREGNFTIHQLTPGKYNVNVFLTGKMDKDWTCVAFDSTQLKEGEKKTGLDLKLIKGGLIAGSVRFSDGKPVYGTYVGVYGPARPRSGAWVQNCLTDKEGRYVLRVPAGANYVYLQGGPGYAPDPGDDRGKDVTVVDGKETKVDFTVPR